MSCRRWLDCPACRRSRSEAAAVPPVLIGNYGHSLATIWDGNFPTTEVQLNISLPIRNRTADANLGKSLAETRRIRNQMQQTEQNIQSDVRTAMENRADGATPAASRAGGA